MRVVALLCYVLALTGGATLAGFVLLLGCDLLPPRPAFPSGWLLDLIWLAIFTLQHSGMARERFKRWCTTLIPPELERSLYAGWSGLLLLVLPIVWQSVPGPVLWKGPRFLVIVPLLAGVGLVLIHRWHDHAEFFGLRQAWRASQLDKAEILIVTGPYRYVRHPLLACLLVFLWAQPILTPTLALLAGGLTGTILLGIVLEERDLLRRFRSDYAWYRRQVPALIPWRRPFEPESTWSPQESRS